MPARTWQVFGLFVLGSLALGAQEPAPASGSFGGSVDVRVVNVEVVVTDAKGERVRGLSAGDLRLKVDGKEMPIEYFSEVSGAGAETPSTPAGSPSAAPAPPGEGRRLLVFIDNVFSVALYRDLVLKAMEKDLSLLEPEDQMAVVAASLDRVEILCDWTGDRRVLKTAFAAARQGQAAGNEVLSVRRTFLGSEEFLREAAESDDPYDDSIYAPEWGRELALPTSTSDGNKRLDSWLAKISRASVATLQAMAPASGRRAVIFLTGGWPAPRLHVPVALAANHLDYTVYPVDVQGIDMMRAVNDASLNHSIDNGGFISNGWEAASEDGMKFLARMTGGRALLNTARFAALEDAVKDTSAYYWLGFTPAWTGDDRNHRIEVEARRPGLTARHRRGYSDLSQKVEGALVAQGMLLAGGLPGAKRLIVEAGPPTRVGSRLEVEVTVAIPVSDLTPLEGADGWRVEAVLSGGAVDKTSSLSDLAEIPLSLTLPGKPEAGSLARYKTKVQLRRTKQRLVFTARDPVGGAVIWGETEIDPGRRLAS